MIKAEVNEREDKIIEKKTMKSKTESVKRSMKWINVQTGLINTNREHSVYQYQK